MMLPNLQPLREVGQLIQNLGVQVMNIHSGMVVSDSVAPGSTFVVLDTSPQDQIPARSICGRLEVGARVVLLAYPPRGLIILGRVDEAPDTNAWIPYVPVWTQGVTVITKTINRAAYKKVGRVVVVNVDMTATSVGTANTELGVTLPVTSASSGPIGPVYFSDAGVGIYNGNVVLLSATKAGFFNGGLAQAYLGQPGGVFTAAIAATDRIIFTATYEATS